MAWTLPSDKELTKVRFDWTGFVALATALAAVQLVLARGVRLDWFDSTEIVIECLIAGLAFYIFLVHSLSAREPFLNLKLLADRNYAIGLALVTIYGMPVAAVYKARIDQCLTVMPERRRVSRLRICAGPAAAAASRRFGCRSA